MSTTPDAGDIPNRWGLQVTGISKSFGPTRALDDVSFSVTQGEVHGLLGGNGSGKSTLIKILAGVYQADPGGSVTVGSRAIAVDDMTPDVAKRMGFRFVHQNPGVFADLSIAENIAIGNGFDRSWYGIDWVSARRRAQTLLERFDIQARPSDALGTLRQSGQTMVAVARALQDVDEGSRAVLVLDEPTASLPYHEGQVLLRALRALSSSGQTIILVSHRSDEVLQVTDSLTVLRDGRHVVTRATKDLSEHGLVELILGDLAPELLAGSTQHRSVPVSNLRPVLEVRDLVGGPLDGVSVSVGEGETVGVCGRLGSGRSELLRMIYGADQCSSGTIALAGQPVLLGSPRDGVDLGISFVPEDRGRDGVFPVESVRENFSISTIGRYWEKWRINRRKEKSDVLSAVTSYSIRCRDADSLISSLSGGNQQKVVVARAMHTSPKLLLLDEPTQGIDVGAKADIYHAIHDATLRGMSVMIASSDHEELASVCDRVVILRDGSITADLSGSALTTAQLIKWTYGAMEA